MYHHFTEMPVWQRAHQLVLEVYSASGQFPKGEQYSLTSQLRRAAISISSNIAEAFGRQGAKDKARFYHNSRGSLYEVENQLIIAADLGYLAQNDQERLKALIRQISHDLNKIILSLK